jgi:hypothetical protein
MTLWQLDWASMCPSFEALILWWPKHEPKPIIHRRLLVWSQSGNCNLLHGLGSATRRGAAPPNPTTRQQQAWHRHRTHRPPQCPVQKLHLGKKKLASSVIMGRANNLDRHRMRLSVASVQCAFYSQAGSATARTPPRGPWNRFRPSRPAHAPPTQRTATIIRTFTATMDVRTCGVGA